MLNMNKKFSILVTRVTIGLAPYRIFLKALARYIGYCNVMVVSNLLSGMSYQLNKIKISSYSLKQEKSSIAPRNKGHLEVIIFLKTYF